MKKISIAQRRLESSQKVISSGSIDMETGKTLTFPKRELLSRSTNGMEATPGQLTGNALIEIDLTPFQEKKLDSSLHSGHETRVYGTLRKCSSGVLYLNLERLTPETPQYISAESIAQMLAVSRKTVYRLHRRDLLPGVRVGRCLRFDFKDVLDYLDSCMEKGMGDDHVS